MLLCENSCACEKTAAHVLFGLLCACARSNVAEFFFVVRYIVNEYSVFPWPISKICFSMQKRPRAHVFGSCARVHAPIWLKFFCFVRYMVIEYSVFPWPISKTYPSMSKWLKFKNSHFDLKSTLSHSESASYTLNASAAQTVDLLPPDDSTNTVYDFGW